jgi:3-hydroxyisobutyrate dehydrogenase-like beta-hydroxyacid dehydrogenase
VGEVGAGNATLSITADGKGEDSDEFKPIFGKLGKTIVLKVLIGGCSQTRVMDLRGSKVVEGNFEPGFRSRFHYKDLNNIVKTALDNKVPLPATSLVHEIVTEGVPRGVRPQDRRRGAGGAFSAEGEGGNRKP